MVRSFDADISRWVRKSNVRMDAVVRRVATVGMTNLVNLTPIDTGRARASWRVGVNRIDRSVDNRPDRRAVSGDTFTASSVAGNALLSDQFARIRSEVKAGTVIWLTNNLPYIKRLEDGWSAQSQYMLRRTFGHLQFSFDSIVREAKAETGP